LVAVVNQPNERSHRLMLRVGFHPTGTTATGACYPLRTCRLIPLDLAAAGLLTP
jgi:RimJ/RimL family protein N-acetyltransferase